MSSPKPSQAEQKTQPTTDVPTDTPVAVVVEIGGRESGLEPTRYGDWEKNGRCIDF
ncbi:MAG: DUF1674 domain-containing protein [Rhodanobacter sp.]|jgi:hypothetical protein|nr:DUF1674 domain-containing protein [Rhodanobacter sp.]